MRKNVASLALLLTTTTGGVAAADGPVDFNIDGQASSITYHLVHKLHKFAGTSHKVEGKARISPEQKAQVMLRAPVESFDSGNVNRDAHMKETVEAAKYASIDLKALCDGLTVPPKLPSTEKRTCKTQLTFHGVTQTFDAPVDLNWESDKKVRASVKFPISVEAYKIERPSLMFVKIDDKMEVDADLVFTR